MATGPSLTAEVVERIYSESGWRYIGISDCYRLDRRMDFWYACDQKWWDIHWHKLQPWKHNAPNGLWCTENRTKQKWGEQVRQIAGRGGQGWSTDPAYIHYGGNSGFQITNIALHLGITYMVLLGFNMSRIKGDANSAHFFGSHPQGLSQSTSYQSMAAPFDLVPKQLPGLGVRVVNATEPTGLRVFPRMSLDDAIKNA